MLQSFLYKLLKKYVGWRYSRTAAVGKTGKKCTLVYFGTIICSHCCTYATEVAVSRWKLSTRWSKTAHATTGLRFRRRINPRWTRFVAGKAGECKWRPRKCQVDPWSRGREVARDVLRSSPKPEKRIIFCHRRGIENFCRLFSTQQRPNVYVSNAWPAPATYHWWSCEHCDQRMGRSP